MTLALLAGMAFACSFLLVALLRRGAERLGVIDVPNERSSHVRPTPRGGGLAIVIVSLAVIAMAGILSGRLTPESSGLLAAAAVVAAIGLIDDLRSISALIRLLVQFVIAAGVVLWLEGTGAWRPWIEPGHAAAGALQGVLIVWIVGMINAYNFMDGIDGLAAIQAVIAAAAWTVAAHLSNMPEVATVGAVLAGATAGFLAHNWAPARIFMGDVGSAYLGFVFAVLPLWASGDFRLQLFGVFVVWPFVFDTFFTLLRRLSRRENVLTAHRSHVYQRLVQSGLSHPQVALLYAAQGVLGAAAGYAVVSAGATPWIPLTLLTFASALSVWLLRVRDNRAALQ